MLDPQVHPAIVVEAHKRTVPAPDSPVVERELGQTWDRSLADALEPVDLRIIGIPAPLDALGKLDAVHTGDTLTTGKTAPASLVDVAATPPVKGRD